MASQENKRLKANLKLRMFLVFLSLSIVFWMLIKLSKTYTSEVVFKVTYVNLPADKVIQNELIDEIVATVQSSGFTLLSYKFRSKKVNLDIHDLPNKKGNQYYYLPNAHLYEIRTQLGDLASVNRISQDTIFIKLGSNITKKIPVELNSNIQFKLGFNLTEKILVSPDSVSITGPKEQLDTIDKIETEMLELVDISEIINQKISLNMIDSKIISFSDTEVLVTGHVDKFTEGSLTVPFEVLNVPNNYSITTFPSEVEVVYQVGLSNFSKITAENFRVVCDLKQSQDNNLNYLIPELKEKSTLITTVKIVPNKIEFLIEE